MKYEIDGKFFDVIIQRKKIKNLYIRIKNGKIYINSPFLTVEKEIYKVIDENITSIKKMIQREIKRNDSLFLGEKVDVVSISNLKHPNYSNGKLYVKDKDKIDEAYKILALPIFKERLDYTYKLFDENIPYPLLRVRKMTSRWGVCNRRNNSITLNTYLIKWDIKYIDYVIIHELSHFVHFDHSKAFWNTVGKYCPTYKELRKNLRE